MLKEYQDCPILTDYPGFVRYGNFRHPSGLACVMSNSNATEKRMYIGRKHAGEEWTDILDWCPGKVTIDRKGYGIFPVSAMSVSVWVNAAAEGRNILSHHLYVFFSLRPFDFVVSR